MNIILAFLLRDVSIEKTYRFHLALKLSGVAAQIAVFYFISRFLEKPQYFLYVFVGIMFSGFFQFWLNVFPENVRQEQYWGTFEPVFLSKNRPLAVILSSASGKFVLFVMEMTLLIAVGKFLFGSGFNLSLAGFIPLFVLNSLAVGGIGLISGSFIMYFKRGDPVNWVLGASFDLLSGVYFPVAVLPSILKGFSQKLPTTSALDLWRGLLIEGKIPSPHQFAVQAAWALVLLAAGAWAFSAAFDKTRVKGDLGNY